MKFHKLVILYCNKMTTEDNLIYGVIVGGIIMMTLIYGTIFYIRGGPQCRLCIENVVYCPTTWEEVINIPI